MRICFEVRSAHGDAILDPEYCEKNPLGGSETAVVKIVHCLRQLGIDAFIITDRSQLPAAPVDVHVALRMWDMLDDGKALGKLNYLWCQDDADQPAVQGLKDPDIGARVYGKCDGLMMISHYQAGQWMRNLAAPPAKLFITSNGIDLPRFQIDRTRLARREPHAYFASTPFRGLSELLELWPIVRTVVGARARLKICSSLKVYHLSEMPHYQALYEKARQLDGVDYLGSIGQAQLREVSASCRALAYPCVFAETSCIAAMEAMASGCVVVSTALGALPETAWRNPLVPLGPDWARLWIEELLRVLVDDRYYTTLAEDNLRLAELMGWQAVAQRWLMRFRSDFVKRAGAETKTQAT